MEETLPNAWYFARFNLVGDVADFVLVRLSRIISTKKGVIMNIRAALSGLMLAGMLVSGAAQATPFSFEFNLPNWDNGIDRSDAVYGTSGLLNITVDNGASHGISQTYLNSQITQVRLTAVGGTFNHIWDDPFTDYFHTIEWFGSDSFISTDLNGIATLDLLVSDDGSQFIVMDSDGYYFQLGRITSSGGATPIAVRGRHEDGTAFFVSYNTQGELAGFAVRSNNTVATIPEPGSLALLGFALGGLAVSRRKRKG